MLGASCPSRRPGASGHRELQMNTTIHPLSAAEPDFDTLYALLDDRHRRAVLAVLLERGSAVALDDLADEVAARHHDSGPAMVPDETWERISVELHHNHLPKLEHARLVDYDTRTRTVVPLQVETVVDHLRTLDDEIASEFLESWLPADAG